VDFIAQAPGQGLADAEPDDNARALSQRVYQLPGGRSRKRHAGLQACAAFAVGSRFWAPATC